MARSYDKVAEPAPKRLQRGTLTRERIVVAGFDVAGESGLASLSMQAVSDRLGVRVSALYWHFRSKESLLQAMQDEAFETFYQLLDQRSRSPHWDEELALNFRAVRTIYRDLPVVCDLVTIRGPNMISRENTKKGLLGIEREAQVLVEAGFEPVEALRAYELLSVYVRGCVVIERLFDEAPSEEHRQNVSSIPRESPEFPVLSRVDRTGSESMASDACFEAGLFTILAGLRAQLDRASSSSTRSKGRRRK